MILFVLSGVAVVGLVLYDVFASVVVPRAVQRGWRVSALLVRLTWRLWRRVGISIEPPQRREAFLSIFAPWTLILLFGVWVAGLICGYGLILYGLKAQIHPQLDSFGSAAYYAGTSLLTIGYGDFVATDGPARFFSLAAAATGLATVAIVLTFLFSLFAWFQRREVFVVTLDARAGAPPSGVALLETHAKLVLLDDLPRLFVEGQTWSAQVLDSHLAYPILSYFRSSHIDVSWISSLGALLDAATLIISTIEGVPKGNAMLMHSVGNHLIYDVAKMIGLPLEGEVGIERREFVQARERLAAAGFSLSDEDRAWTSFVRLRSEYATSLNAMARYWTIEPAQWVGDRSSITPRH